MSLTPACAAVSPSDLDRIELPPGFKIDIYAEVPGARSLVVVEELNAVFVSTRGPAIFAVVDSDGDKVAEQVVKVRNANRGAPLSCPECADELVVRAE